MPLLFGRDCAGGDGLQALPYHFEKTGEEKVPTLVGRKLYAGRLQRYRLRGAYDLFILQDIRLRLAIYSFDGFAPLPYFISTNRLRLYG